MALSNKHRMFVEQYLVSWNATNAAIKAGYSPNSAYSVGSRLLKDADIQKFIQERIEQVAMSADEVLLRLAKQARGSMKPFVKQNGETISVDITTASAKKNIDLIKRIKSKKRLGTNDNGEWQEVFTEIEIVDPQSALVHLGRHHALFTDKQELIGEPVVQIRYVNDWRDTTPDAAPGTADSS